MEGGNSNWRPVQGDAAGMNMDAAPSGDWRDQLQPEARQRIVNKIMDTLQKHLPIYGQDGLGELRKIAQRFEEKIYTAAVNQSDYLRKISLKMLTMETKSQNTSVAGQMPPNPTGQNPPDPGSHGLQPQVQNTAQSLPIHLSNQSQPRQTLTPGIQNNLASAAVQVSANVTSMVPSMNGLSQSISTIGQTSNLQSISSISQNIVNNTVQGISPNIYGNSQRQMPGKQQQPLVSQQQSQNAHVYAQQLQQQQQIYKQKLSHPSLMQPQLQLQQQQQQQQQSLLSATQLQSSQQPVMQIPSTLQSSQTSLQQAQPPMQSVPHTGHQQNQPNILQQSSSPLLQQHSHAVLRQQPLQPSAGHQQTSSLQQQSAPISQQPILPPQQQQQQQQQLLGNQSNMSNIQQNQLLGQQSNIPDIQQQQQQRRLTVQQNNLMGMQQSQQMLNPQNMSLHQQVVSQNNIPGLQQLQSQQHQLLGSQPNMSNMHQHHHTMHVMQPQKTSAQQQPQQQQPQGQQTGTSLLQSHVQQPQPHPAQQQHMSQIQSQPMQIQQQMAIQQQTNPIQREMQQRLQASNILLQSQNAFEQQKPLYQSQRGLPEASSNSMDSTAQTCQQGPDWQEEIYQKLQSMRELYYADLTEINQRIILKCQQHEVQLPPGKHSEQLEGMKKIKQLMNHLLAYLQMPKSSIQPSLKDKLPHLEKQIYNFIPSERRKNVPPQQFSHPGGNTQSMPQQPSSHPPIQQHDSHANQMPLVVQGSVTSTQSTAVSSMQNGSLPLSVGVPATQQNIMNSLQACPNIDPSQSCALASLQEGTMGSLQQDGMGPLQQTTFNASMQSNMTTLASTNNVMQPNGGTLQRNANVLQNQHVKQEHQNQQLIHSQQIKQQMPQRQMQQQKQQILQQQPQIQQQYQQQQKQAQSTQLLAHQIPQLHQLNEMNDVKVRQASVIKSGPFQSHFPGNQRQTYHQQLKPGSSFPISSPQSLQVPSPQISQHSSPQVEHSLLSSVPKAGTPLQTSNSPFVVPSPSTPLAPSPLPGDNEKQVSSISSLSNSANIGHQQISALPTQVQSLAVVTPGISASPLLAEYIGSDSSHANTQAALPVKPSATERPIERLVKAAQSLSPQLLSSSVRDIGSVVSMIDRIAGSAPGNGSRAAIGEDLVAMTKCRLQARSFMSQDGSVGMKKMKRKTNAMPLNVMSSAGSVNDSFKRSSTDAAELESTATSRVKRPKAEATHDLLEEIREINRQLIDTVVDITDEDADSIAAAAGGDEGTVVKCSYCAVAVSPSLRSQFASAQVSPISPLRLLVPSSYPDCSPVLLDRMPVGLSKESEDLSVKAKSRFSVSLRTLSQPMSLGAMVSTWDACARKVLEEYAQQNGGGSFSSRYGSWENCVTV